MLLTIEPQTKEELDELFTLVTERLIQHIEKGGQIAEFAANKLGPANVTALVVSLLRDMPQGYLDLNSAHPEHRR